MAGTEIRIERRRVRGATILLGSGDYFDYEAPEATPLTIEDVAWGLAAAGRFAGQCWSPILGRRVIYTAAEHCVRLSLAVPAPLALEGLMHELGEVTCGDMTAPLKGICPGYRALEKRCERAGLAQFGIVMRDPATIKQFDLRMLATERRDLMRWGGEEWEILDGVEPLPERIIPWPAEAAAEAFLARYRALAA